MQSTFTFTCHLLCDSLHPVGVSLRAKVHRRNGRTVLGSTKCPQFIGCASPLWIFSPVFSVQGLLSSCSRYITGELEAYIPEHVKGNFRITYIYPLLHPLTPYHQIHLELRVPHVLSNPSRYHYVSSFSKSIIRLTTKF
jgi:hypothetical protein